MIGRETRDSYAVERIWCQARYSTVRVSRAEILIASSRPGVNTEFKGSDWSTQGVHPIGCSPTG